MEKEIYSSLGVPNIRCEKIVMLGENIVKKNAYNEITVDFGVDVTVLEISVCQFCFLDNILYISIN